LYQPIYTANVETIGTNPDLIRIGQSLLVPCLTATTVAADVNAGDAEGTATDQLVFTFNKASAPPFIINSGIIDGYLANITEVTDGRVTFVDPEEVNRDHSAQFDLVTSGAVDGAYVLNSTIADTHPLLQLTMVPMFGGSAEQTAVSLWRLHDQYLSNSDYFDDAELLGFVAAPAAHIWRDASHPITESEDIADKNLYAIPYFNGLDTRGPAVMRAEYTAFSDSYSSPTDEPPALFLAHGAAIALGVWDAESQVAVTEVDNGMYTPTFSVILSNEAWAQISDTDQQAIREVSGEALSHRSEAWDGFDNAFRSKMLEAGLVTSKADETLIADLWLSALPQLNSWLKSTDVHGIEGVDAIDAYIGDMLSLKHLLIYRGEETSIDQHPFLAGNN
jgi:TRAP-type C4-dicarboxylate transport system substrate-binding protein